MAREVINVGAAPNDGQGDPIRTSFIKTNSNFGELYARAQENPPATLFGTVGDEAGMYAYDSSYFYYCFAPYTTGTNIIWARVTQIGNVSVTTLASGSTNVDIPAPNGNVTMTVGGTANVGVLSSDKFTLKGDFFPSANAVYDLGSATQQWRSLYVSNSSIWLGGTQLTVGAGNVLQVQGANVITYTTGNNLSVGDITGNNLTVLNATISNVLAVNNDISVTDDVTVGSDITAGGTITAGFFVGDGSGLTNLPGGGGNAGPGNTTQIINGFSKVFIPVSSGNVQVDVGLSAGIVKFISQGMVLNGELDITGNISTVVSTGNVTAPYFIGDGSLLTNIPGGGGNASQISNGLSKVAITAVNGNVTVDVGATANVLKISTAGIDVTGGINLSGNVNAINSTGNITAPYFIGDGSQLTNVGGGGNYGNADVALFLTTYTGNIAANNVSVTNNANANILYANAAVVTNAVTSNQFFGNLTGDVTGDLTGNTTGIHYGLVGSIDILELSWDFGTFTGVITNPMTWLINNIGGGFDAGTFLAANATDIDIGVLTN